MINWKEVDLILNKVEETIFETSWNFQKAVVQELYIYKGGNYINWGKLWEDFDEWFDRELSPSWLRQKNKIDKLLKEKYK